VSLPAKHVPHFKPGKELRERVDGRSSSSSSRAPAAMAKESDNDD